MKAYLCDWHDLPDDTVMSYNVPDEPDEIMENGWIVDTQHVATTCTETPTTAMSVLIQEPHVIPPEEPVAFYPIFELPPVRPERPGKPDTTFAMDSFDRRAQEDKQDEHKKTWKVRAKEESE